MKAENKLQCSRLFDILDEIRQRAEAAIQFAGRQELIYLEGKLCKDLLEEVGLH
jgi:hypothetical protein